jgi:hypothetical protein
MTPGGIFLQNIGTILPDFYSIMLCKILFMLFSSVRLKKLGKFIFKMHVLNVFVEVLWLILVFIELFTATNSRPAILQHEQACPRQVISWYIYSWFHEDTKFSSMWIFLHSVICLKGFIPMTVVSNRLQTSSFTACGASLMIHLWSLWLRYCEILAVDQNTEVDPKMNLLFKFLF